MEPVRNDVQENTSWQVHPGGIKRASTPAPGAGESVGAALSRTPRAAGTASANSLLDLIRIGVTSRSPPQALAQSCQSIYRLVYV